MNERFVIDKTRTCCFSGHRPETVTLDEADIKSKLKVEINKAINDGYTTFISGMARGVDIWAAELIVEKKRINKDVRLVCAQPYEFFSKAQGWVWNVRYSKIIPFADKVVSVSYKNNPDCCMLRNKWMVDRSSRLIAVFKDFPGGTKETIDYAISKNKDIRMIEVK